MFVIKFSFAALLVVSFSLFVVAIARKQKEIDYEEIPTFPNDYKSVVGSMDDSLESIYDLSKDFIDSTVPVNFSIAVDGDDFDLQDDLEKYAGLISYVAIMLAIGLLIPLIGIIFCASRLLGDCCGAKAVERLPKQGHVSIIIAGGFTIVFSAFIIFAIVVGMRSNVVMEKGAENVFDKMIITMKDIIKYSDNTFIQIDHLMKKNYEQFTTELNHDLLDIGKQANDVIYPSELKDMADGLNDFKNSIAKLKGTQEAINKITSGKAEMEDMKSTTLVIAQDCTADSDPNIQKLCKNIEKLTTSWIIPNFNFDDLSGKITAMEMFRLSVIQCVLSVVEIFGKDLDTKLKDISEDVMIQTGTAGDEIENHLIESKSSTDGVKDWMYNRISNIEDAQSYYDEWGKLRYGLTFVLPLILILITIFVILGFLTGICCRTKNYKEKGCGNASVASDFFMINTSLIFIFTLVFAIVICGYYAFGLLGQRYICNTFHTMDNIDGLKNLDQNLNVEQHFGDGVTLEHLLNSCHNNKPVYEVLLLKNQFDLETIINYLESFGIKDAIDKFNEKISEEVEILNTVFPDFNPFTTLKNLKLDDITVPVHADQLNIMNDIVEPLKELSPLIPENIEITNILKDYEKFTNHFTNLQNNFAGFQTLIKMGGETTFAQRCDEFHANLEYAKKSGDRVMELGIELSTGSVSMVQNYLNRIKHEMLNTVGLCAPASNAIKATLTEACGNVFNPINAFWVANFFALIAFIPLLIIFIYLVGYFRQYIMTDEDRYRQEHYYLYNPPGTRGSTIQAYDVRAHRKPSTADYQQNPTLPQTTPAALVPKSAIPNHYYNPNSGHTSAQPPIYPSLSMSDNTLSSAAALAEKGDVYLKPGIHGRNMRRQHDYPYAMKGTSITTEA